MWEIYSEPEIEAFLVVGLLFVLDNYYLNALTYALNCVDKLDSEIGLRL